MAKQNKQSDNPSEITDNPVEEAPRQRLSVVGLGASAGGLMPLRAFLSALPANTGMTFVVVTHLSPQHESILAELLQPHTEMPVQQVTERIAMRANHVYVIPPGKRLVVLEGYLDLTEFDMPRGQRLQIDTFFRSLAEHHGDGGAVIFSGSGSDGAVGIQSIKEKGGLILVQDPTEAEYDGMPKSAIATGLADIVAPVTDLATQLVAAKRTGATLELSVDPAHLTSAAEETLNQLLMHLRVRTGHDFSGYKRATILRRIARRMQLTQLSSLTAYLHRLRHNGEESDALYRDLLIHVTEFFRDQEAWAALEQDVIPHCFAGKGRDDSVRVWAVGCATGEEAYGIAILLLEYATTLAQPPQIQVFASDLGEGALDFARRGTYPQAIAANVSPERLERFFVQENSHYRVRDEVRERVLFTPHNLLQDPPFSKLDLILCRNLLIYLQRPLQEQVFETFHYALHPRGYLFLGSAESTESITSLFEVVDKQHRIYRRGEQRQGTLVLPTLPLRPKHMHALEQVEESIAQGGSIDEMALPWLPENVAPPNLFVDAHYHVLQLSESAGRYLQHPAGALTPNVLRLVRPELQGELRTALFRALETEKATLTRSVPVQFNGAPHAVAMLIRPVRNGKEHLQALIFFLEDETPISENTTSVKETQSASFQQLQTELSHAQQQYQSLREEYETTVEELRSANEELQSTNEEYRSTVEELETSKEELQSINEELQTVNLELRSKVAETSQANSDLHNLFAATEIATLFLDRELKIKRYTPRAAELFNLMPGDQGRPISHLRTNLEYTELEQDARQVLKHLVPVVREIEGDQDHIFQVNVRPYRTQNDHIDGIVITFVDITGPKRAEAALYESQERLQLALATANMGTFIWYPAEDRGEPDARMLALFGQPANGALNLAEALSHMIHPDDSAGYAEAVAHATDPHGDGTLQTDIRVVHLNGDVRWLAITAQVYFAAEPRQAVRMVGTAIDITERKQIEATLRANDERQTFLLKLSDILHPLTDPIVVQAEACRLLGEQLGVDRAYYVEVDEVAGQARVHQNYLRDDSPSLVGSFPLVEVGWTVPYLQRGEVVIVADSQTDAIVPDADRGWMADLQMHAHITWPVIQQGKLMGALCVTERVPRVWTELDVELTSEAAERIGAAIVRARAEEALHESQQRYQQALAAAQMGTWRYDVVADINYFDERSQEIFGLDRATYTAAEVDSFVHPDDRAMLVQAREAALDPRGDGACHYVHRAIHPDGTVRWVRLNCQVTFAGEGQERHPVQAVGVITDVTERRETANALLASEERFRALVDASAQMVWTTDPQGAVVEDSPSWRAVTGQSYEEFAGRGWMDVIHPDDQSVTAAAWQEAVATVTPHHVECRVYDAASDQYRWHVVRAVPLQNADGSVRGWVGMNSDIQSRKVAEAALQALNESLEAQVAERTQQVRKLIMQLSMSEQEERQRISLVLHDDLQQRLYAIKFQLSFLRNVWNEPTDLSQEDKEQFFSRLEEQIQESLQQMRSLSIELSPPVLTGEGLDVALGWLATQMREQHGLSVHLQVQENFPSLSTKLRVLLFQIIREWLFNVVKHAGVLEAVVTLNFTDETLQIEVIDEGKGFDEDVLQNDTYQGHGLQQNQRRLELIGATTKIVSSPEAGTHISLSCPLPAEERKGRT